MISTTLYEEHGFGDVITGLVKIYNPLTVVELGTQQGASAILLAQALKMGLVYTYDLFQPYYGKPPCAETHADFDQAIQNVKDADMENRIIIVKADAFDAYVNFQDVDILHVDLCNYYDNVHKVLKRWHKKVNKAIILEGGRHNDWQKKYEFEPFTPLLKELWIERAYDVIILKKDTKYALTIMVKK